MNGFNRHLRAVREEKNLTQQELADKLGVTKLTVGRWERGETHPNGYYRQKLCDLFQKTGQELGFLIPPASVDRMFPGKSMQSNLSHDGSDEERKKPISSPIWHVPYRHNPFFTGREETLQCLHQRLSRKSAALPQALSGLGGIGKTQTALEYCYRHSDSYRALFWVRADTREMLLVDMVAIAGILNLPEKALQCQRRREHEPE
jgi:transcriptional regulator with XRE-family HTH domain